MLETRPGRRRMISRHRTRAFTLVEMLVTIAILGIVLGASVASYGSLIERHRLKSAVETLYADLQLARMEAIKRGTDIHISFNPTQWCYGLDDEVNECDCTLASGSGNCEIGEDDAITDNEFSRVVHGSDFKGVQINEDHVFSGDTTQFSYIRGTADNGTVTLASTSGKTAQVVVSPLGRVRLCSDDIGGLPGC